MDSCTEIMDEIERQAKLLVEQHKLPYGVDLGTGVIETLREGFGFKGPGRLGQIMCTCGALEVFEMPGVYVRVRALKTSS